MAALTEVLVPDLGDFADVPVIELLVAEGDAVQAEDPLIVLESDKATMEIPAPSAGVVRRLLLSVGDRVSTGTPIAELEPGAAPATEDPTATSPAEATPAESTPAQATSPVEAAPADPPAPAPEATSPAAPDAEHPATPDAEYSENGSAPGPPPAEIDRGEVYAGPAVRRHARERGIDLRSVRGSGRRGRITLEDLDRPQPVTPFGDATAVAGTLEGLTLAPWPTVDFARLGEIERVPLSRIQKISGANLARNWIRIPHVTHNEDADITELEAFRVKLNSEQSEVKVTMVALLVKAVAGTLQAFPQFNASLDGDELVLKRYWNVGFAADTPNGLVVPVVHGADQKGLLEIAAELSDLSGRARAGRLSPAEMSGSTFTISSLGGIGGTSFTPIINAPEVAILGVVRSVNRPVWDGREFVPRLMLPLSLSYDHRVIDGAAAARFCAHLAGVLADMRRLLL
jgi:pyruvate dehydrogenase E2 component (dihydrolipoamide acetyltransferase)